MQAAPARYVSVSELYSTDEVELLLDEIRDLEPTSCRGEDVQDFEIAGSGCGGGGGGRSPAGTSCTERSWDSHAQYRRAPPPRPRPLAPLYLTGAHLRTARGAAAAAVLLAAAAAAALVWAASGPRLPAPRRPLALAALSSLLLHAALLLVRVTRLHRLMPLDWTLLGGACAAWAAVSLCGGASLVLHEALQESPPPPLLLAAAALGYVGGAAGAGGAGAAALRRWRAGGGGARGAYRAVPAAPGLDAPL